MKAFSVFTACFVVAMMVFSGISPAHAARDFSYDNYALALSYVDAAGRVDYAGLTADRAALYDFLEQLRSLPASVYERWPSPDQIAFWINVYNALTLAVIVDNYPLHPRRLASAMHPPNSIRQIPGVWSSLEFKVMGRTMTLDQIKHDRLRGTFDQPRLHFALVCAAGGCPPLRNEPYIGARLDQQLDDQVRRVLAQPSKFHVDVANRTVYLSPIFKWFADDFAGDAGGMPKLFPTAKAQRAVLLFLSRYAAPSERSVLLSRPKVVYLPYDWALNNH